MKKLIKGIIDFRKNSLTEYREKFSKLASGHFPDTLFIACCDSRVVPNTFASSDPGDLFVLRNIGNLIPPYHEHNQQTETSVAAAIEFSLLYLHVSDIVICGHSECAAMRSFIDKAPHPELFFTNNWLKYALPSYKRFQENHNISLDLTEHNILSQINVLQQIDHLKTYPWVKEKLKNHQIKIHGWWFDLATADVHHYDLPSESFILIDANEEKKLL